MYGGPSLLFGLFVGQILESILITVLNGNLIYPQSINITIYIHIYGLITYRVSPYILTYWSCYILLSSLSIPIAYICGYTVGEIEVGQLSLDYWLTSEAVIAASLLSVCIPVTAAILPTLSLFSKV